MLEGLNEYGLAGLIIGILVWFFKDERVAREKEREEERRFKAEELNTLRSVMGEIKDRVEDIVNMTNTLLPHFSETIDHERDGKNDCYEKVYSKLDEILTFIHRAQKEESLEKLNKIYEIIVHREQDFKQIEKFKEV